MIDDAMDAYVEWREECVRVWDAYHAWRSAVRTDAALAFRAYLAALDREERAAEVYAVLSRELESVASTTRQARPRIRRPPTERVGTETADDE
jgi:hypothetical protein